MPRVVYDPSVSSIVVDLLLEAADGGSSLLIPVVLDTGASLTIVATDIMAQLGYDPANPALDRQRIVTGSGIEFAPRWAQDCWHRHFLSRILSAELSAAAAPEPQPHTSRL